LGMLLYVVLTGAHPVPGSGSRAQRIQAALDGHISRASDSAPESLRNVLRGDLDAILAMALRKDPTERYATAQALKDDLARWLHREPVSARRGTTLYRARKFVAKHRLAVIAASLAIVGLCGTSVFAIQQARESDRQRDRAQIEAKRAFAQLRFNTLMMSAIGEPSRPISAEQMLDHGVKLLETEYVNDPEFVVDELIHISGRYMDWGNRQREYEVLTQAEAIARRTANPLQLARVQCSTVETDIAFDRIDRAIERLAEGQTALAAAQGANAGDQADCLSASANLKNAQGRTQDAVGDLQRAVELLEQQHMTNNVRYAPLLDYLGTMYQSLGDFRRSYDYTHRARLAKEAAGYAGTVGWNASLHNEATALRDMGEIQPALVQEADVIQRDLAQHPNDPLPVAQSAVYAGLLLRADRPTEALRWFDRAQADAQAASDLVTRLNSQIGRARVFISLGQLDRASAMLEVVDQQPDLHSEQLRHQYMRARLARAELSIAQDRSGQALGIITPLLAECREPGRGLGLYLQSALLLASRASRQDPEAAARFAQEALQVAESRARDPEHSLDVGESALVLAQARLGQNDLRAAGAAVHRAETILTDAVGKEHSSTKAAATLAAEISQRVELKE
jgi:eukaryotic-like serine/threonine-protein kinase